jgi:hypothetical protein
MSEIAYCRQLSLPQKLLLFLLLFSPALLTAQQTYAGAMTLGPFRIDRDVSMKNLFDRLGRPSSVAGDVFCYQSEDGKVFLVLTRMAEDSGSKTSGVATLSSFRNCTDRRPQTTPDELMMWKTDKGIGLGSTAEDVQKAYGKPSGKDRIEGTKYRWVIHGDFRNGHYSDDHRPELGDAVLVYRGGTDDLRTSEFGIRNGKVVWIVLSKNE